MFRSCNRFALALAGLSAAMLTAVMSSAGAHAVHAETSLPTFACYEASFSSLRSPSARISDQFGTRLTPVGAPTTICAEASISSRSKIARPLHLVCHSITDRRSGLLGVRILTRFGVEKPSLVAARGFCTPASIATSGAIAAPPADLDAFTCYAIRARPGTARTVAVADEFGPTGDVLGQLTRVCAPAKVNGTGSVQTRLLACYRLTSEAAAPSVIVRTRLGLLKASTGLRRQLCVPSSRV